MRAIVQRVNQATVSVDNEIIGRIGVGLLVLAGFEEADQTGDLDWMAQKIVRLRVFPDAQGVMNRSVMDLGGEILAVSQFTLYASTRKGNRPSWGRAARCEVSRPFYAQFIERLSHALGRPVASGLFGADMKVSLTNDGPVTIAIDSRNPE